MRFRILQLGTTLAGALVALAFQQGPKAGKLLTPEQREILSHQSLVQLDDGQGGLVEAIRLEGVNLQIVNGLGATNGYPSDPTSVDPLLTQTNGLGNLIVGYAEAGAAGDDRTGSHDLVVGIEGEHSGFGGAVLGRNNVLTGPFATATGGVTNRADGLEASIAGGYAGSASGNYAVVTGGRANVAAGLAAGCFGGKDGNAGGLYSVVRGGDDGVATGNYATVLGGSDGIASGYYSVVRGGWQNKPSGTTSAVGGGHDGDASGTLSSITGGRWNTVTGSTATITGGRSNDALASFSLVCGGQSNEVSGTFATYGVVMGGIGNFATSSYATVSGGWGRSSTAPYDWVAGTLWQNQ